MLQHDAVVTIFMAGIVKSSFGLLVANMIILSRYSSAYTEMDPKVKGYL